MGDGSPKNTVIPGTPVGGLLSRIPYVRSASVVDGSSSQAPSSGSSGIFGSTPTTPAIPGTATGHSNPGCLQNESSLAATLATPTEEPEKVAAEFFRRNRKRLRVGPPRPSQAPELRPVPEDVRASNRSDGKQSIVTARVSQCEELELDFSVSMPARPSAGPAPTEPSGPSGLSASSSGSFIEGWEVLKKPPTRACAKMLVRAKLRCACCFRLLADCAQKR